MKKYTRIDLHIKMITLKNPTFGVLIYQRINNKSQISI
jgi:hypothetical protein